MSEKRLPLLLGVLVMVTVVGAGGCEREALQEQAVAQEDYPVEGPGSGGETEVDRSDQFTTAVRGSQIELGTASDVHLTVLPGPNLKINLEFPWKIEFDDVAGVVFAGQQLTADAMDLQEDSATIPVNITVKEPGEIELTGRADFSVCNDERCDILRDEPLRFVVHATE